MRARLLLFSLFAAPCVAASAAAAQGATTVILVRHAEKDATNPLARNPPLSREGQRRARDLAAALQGRRVNAILVTPIASMAMTSTTRRTRSGEPRSWRGSTSVRSRCVT